ncbi:MAG: pyruvate kinase [Dehalococcoidia bacterium]|nr:pyruvate kinase [Dehalococcoidia bacterium]
MISDPNLFRKTKIVCTIGPASGSKGMIEKLALAGMNVARLNFSHGTYEQHAAHIEAIRRISSKLSLPLAILQDLPGPKIRTGELKKETVWLKEGDDFTLTNKQVVGDEHIASVSLASLPNDVSPGNIIFLNDGAIKLEVASTTDSEIRCKVVVGGILAPKRGVNIPGVRLNVPSITDEDLSHLLFGLEHGVDFVALSFVREAADVRQLRQFLQAKGADVPLIAKIEKHEAVGNIDEIIAEADGIMVARGDLGVEIPLKRVPLVQKELISKCNRVGKPVIVATQMLQSMIHSPFPTRAEVSDVANAILDGTDAIMLSGETAIGKYPEEATLMMRRIAIETEIALPYHRILSEKKETLIPQTDDAISYAACHIAEQLGAVGIIAYTTSGSTAQRVAKYRPKAPILAIAPKDSVRRKLALYWGVSPYQVPEYTSVEEMFEQGAQLAIRLGLAKRGDLVVVTAGVPLRVPGSTNMLKVQKID